MPLAGSQLGSSPPEPAPGFLLSLAFFRPAVSRGLILGRAGPLAPVQAALAAAVRSQQLSEPLCFARLVKRLPACQNIRALAEQNPLRGERQTPAGLQGRDLHAAAPRPGARCLQPPALAALGTGTGCCWWHRVPGGAGRRDHPLPAVTRGDAKTTFPSANADPVGAADNIEGNYSGNKLFALCARPRFMYRQLFRSSCADC